ncbi:MAG: hypothetical protein ACK40Q_10175, partial [Pseudothermotoga sp.]
KALGFSEFLNLFEGENANYVHHRTEFFLLGIRNRLNLKLRKMSNRKLVRSHFKEKLLDHVFH